MDKQKEIEKMAEAVVASAIVSKAIIDDKVAINLNAFVKNMIKLGYRKQSDTAREIVKRLKELLHKHEHRSQTDGVSFYQMNAESFCDEINELAAQYGVENEE